MKNNHRFISAALILIGIFCAGAAVQAADTNITGTWTMAVTTQAGSGTATFVLTQDGESLTGTYKGSMGTAPVTGTNKDGNVILDFTAARMGQEIKVQYTGTVEGDTMQGKVKIGPGGGTFTGKMAAVQ
jgi:hypothetical protein